MICKGKQKYRIKHKLKIHVRTWCHNIKPIQGLWLQLNISLTSQQENANIITISQFILVFNLKIQITRHKDCTYPQFFHRKYNRVYCLVHFLTLDFLLVLLKTFLERVKFENNNFNEHFIRAEQRTSRLIHKKLIHVIKTLLA